MQDIARLSPLEVIRAGKWESALFTTYALSLGFFEGAVLPSLQRAGLRSATILADPDGIAEALNETGARHVGRAYAVEPVRVAGGVFHPKLFSVFGDDGHHLLIGSGNLTFGGWGCNIETIEHLIARAHPAAFSDLAGLLDALPYTDRVTIASDDALAEHAENCRREGEGAVEGTVRLLHNLDRGIAPQLVEFADSLGGAERLTVAAPYFGGASAVQELAHGLGLAHFEVHVASHVAMNGEHYPFNVEPNAAPVILEVLADETRRKPLHAKLIEVVCARGKLLFSGSVNASRRALVDPVNVELGVLRISEDGRQLPRVQHAGTLPPLPEREALDGGTAAYVARCEYLGGQLKGMLLCPSPSGEWAVGVDADGERESLGVVKVTASGDFQLNAPSLERYAYSARRVLLSFSRGKMRVRGFLSFADIIAASRRLGTIASPLIRIAAGSDEDGDWIDILEWFARNPEQTVNAWRSSPKKESDDQREDQYVALASLGPQPDPSAYEESSARMAPSGLLDRLLARLRFVVRETGPNGGSKPRGDVSEDDPDEAARKRDLQRRAKLANAFDRLMSVLGERAPLDPPTELRRMAEIGIHVLGRHPEDADRIVSFLRNWVHLACDHLPGRDDPEMDKLAVTLVGLSGAYDGDAKRARRQLIDIVGCGPAMQSLLIDPSDADLRAVVDLVKATVGIETWISTLQEIASIKIALDDVQEIVAALDRKADLPLLSVLNQSEELSQLNRLMSKGKLASIYFAPRTATGCPRCHIKLSSVAIDQFRHQGIVKNECCYGIMLRSDV